MRLFDRLLGRSNATDRAPVRNIVTKTKSLAQQVAEAPADFNRRTRRAVGHPFRWLSYANQTGAKMTDRYTRRHGARVLATVAKGENGTRTRRERKEAARVLRAMP